MPMRKCTATVLQINPVAGNITANVEKIRETYIEADDRGVDLVVTPEWSVTGFPLCGLLHDGDFLDAAAAGIDALALVTRHRQAALVVGAPFRDRTAVHNAAFILQGGNATQLARGRIGMGVTDALPPYISPEGKGKPFDLGGVKLGILLGDDIRLAGPSLELRNNGADILVALIASPFRPEALRTRVNDVAGKRVAETGLPLLLVNMVGGQEELVFDGGSFYLDATGLRVAQLPQWEECDMDCTLSGPFKGIADESFPERLEGIWRAMVMGVADYVGKSGFSDVVLGMSGGMDSALVAAVAADAIGPARVHCVRLPSRYTSDLSNNAAEEMCRAWGMDMHTLPIEQVVEAAAATLTPVAPEGLKQLTTENMQARARGYLLMTVSNDRGWLLLSTGNKSEASVGYATLYGDMCGAFNPVKDVYKTTIFELARWRNAHCPQGLLGPTGVVIPPAIIERPPSAELAPGQRDTDSLPPYHLLDAILEQMIDEHRTVAEIVAGGFDRDTVARVHRMVKSAEFKRRQGAPGVRIFSGNVPCDDRLPVVNGFSLEMAGALTGSPGK